MLRCFFLTRCSLVPSSLVPRWAGVRMLSLSLGWQRHCGCYWSRHALENPLRNLDLPPNTSGFFCWSSKIYYITTWQDRRGLLTLSNFSSFPFRPLSCLQGGPRIHLEMELFDPYEWPKINGFNSGYFTPLLGVISLDPPWDARGC